MSWFVFSIIGYFLNAISITINKAILSKDIPSPSTMTFLTATLGMVSIVLIPFGVTFTSPLVLLFSLIAGIFFVAAIFAMFYALQKGQASNIPVFIGAFQPIFVFFLAFFFLAEILTKNYFTGFIFLTLGGLIIALRGLKDHRKVFGVAILSSVFFAVTFVVSKWIFGEIGFINGLFWTRLGAFIGGLILILNPYCRREIKKVLTRRNKKKNTRATMEFLAAQTTGAVSLILIYYAFSLGSVTLVNALQGVQYIFIFVLVEPLGYFFPKLWSEDLTKKAIVIKLLAITSISIGLFFIAK